MVLGPTKVPQNISLDFEWLNKYQKLTYIAFCVHRRLSSLISVMFGIRRGHI